MSGTVPGEDTPKKSFWSTTTGTITKVGAFISAITALILAIKSFTATVAPATNSNTTPGYQQPDNTGKNVPVKPPEDGKNTPADPKVVEPAATSPNIIISAFSLRSSEVTMDKEGHPAVIQADVEATNTGTAIATQCMFTLEANKGTLGNASSPAFSLNPGEKYNYTINALMSTSADIAAKLSCSNAASITSSSAPVTVWAFGSMHSRPIQ